MSNEAFTQLICAIRGDDFDKVEELVEQNKVRIDKFACYEAVQPNRSIILTYLLAKSTIPLSAWSFALKEAVRIQNESALFLIISTFKNEKMRYIQSEIDSVVIQAIYEVTKCERKKQLTSHDAFELIELITRLYREG